jgi:hypothetical protein
LSTWTTAGISGADGCRRYNWATGGSRARNVERVSGKVRRRLHCNCTRVLYRSRMRWNHVKRVISSSYPNCGGDREKSLFGVIDALKDVPIPSSDDLFPSNWHAGEPTGGCQSSPLCSQLRNVVILMEMLPSPRLVAVAGFGGWVPIFGSRVVGRHVIPGVGTRVPVYSILTESKHPIIKHQHILYYCSLTIPGRDNEFLRDSISLFLSCGSIRHVRINAPG